MSERIIVILHWFDILTYSMPRPISLSNQSLIFLPTNGHQANSFGRIGDIKSGFNFLGLCGPDIKLTIIPITKHVRQGMAENHMYETSYIFR